MGFAFPLFLGNLFQQLYNTADSLIVGNFLGSDALAAVSSSGSLTFLLVGFFQGMAMGAGVIIARYFGARQQNGAAEGNPHYGSLWYFMRIASDCYREWCWHRRS